MSVGIPIHCFRRFTTGTSVLVGRGLVCQLTSSNILCVKKYTLSTNRGKGGGGGGIYQLFGNEVTNGAFPWPQTILKQLKEWNVIVSCDQLGGTLRAAPTLFNRGEGFFFGGGSLEILVWECASGTSEPLVYTRPISAEFCYPLLELTPKHPPYPRVTIFQKIQRASLSSLLDWIACKFKSPISFVWLLIPGFPNVD